MRSVRRLRQRCAGCPSNGVSRDHDRPPQKIPLICTPVFLSPASKPVALYRRILDVAGRPGGVVLDPFSGGGTGAIAAMRSGMRSVLIEREVEYVDITKIRVANEMRRRAAAQSTASRHPAEGSQDRRAASPRGDYCARGETAFRSASLICSPTAPPAATIGAAPTGSARGIGVAAVPQSPPAEPHWRQRLAPAPKNPPACAWRGNSAVPCDGVDGVRVASGEIKARA
jgi:hypothetical protein